VTFLAVNSTWSFTWSGEYILKVRRPLKNE